MKSRTAWSEAPALRPIRKDGTVDVGDIADQAHRTFTNLLIALDAADLDTNDVVQVVIYLTDISDIRIVDDVYHLYFEAPYPCRTIVGVCALAVQGMAIEIVACARST